MTDIFIFLAAYFVTVVIAAAVMGRLQWGERAVMGLSPIWPIITFIFALTAVLTVAHRIGWNMSLDDDDDHA